MKINNLTVNAKLVAFDGCHKIYLLESDDDVLDAEDHGYAVYPINELEDIFEGSCSLRFISNWKLDMTYAHQFEEATFTE